MKSKQSSSRYTTLLATLMSHEVEEIKWNLVCFPGIPNAVSKDIQEALESIKHLISRMRLDAAENALPAVLNMLRAHARNVSANAVKHFTENSELILTASLMSRDLNSFQSSLDALQAMTDLEVKEFDLETAEGYIIELFRIEQVSKSLSTEQIAEARSEKICQRHLNRVGNLAFA